MTQQTNIADIVKPLGWLKWASHKRVDYWCKSAFGEVLVTPALRDPFKYKIKATDYSRPTAYNSIKEAQDVVFDIHCRAISAYLDLTKLQPQPAPFWKPRVIAECPRHAATLYMLLSPQNEPMLVKPKGKSVWSMVPLGQETSADGYTHYAAITPCEVQS